jgi:hypothetical protein
LHHGDADTLQVDAGRAEVGVAELALNHVERHALAGELDGVGGVHWCGAKRRRLPAWAASRAKLDAHVRARPRPPAGRPSMTQNDGRIGNSTRTASHGRSCSHPDLAAPAVLTVADQQRPARGVEVALAERERFLNARPAAPRYGDQRAQPEALSIVAAWRMITMISSTVGGSAGYRNPLLRGGRPA